MTYEQAIKKYPRLGELSVSELQLIKEGMQLGMYVDSTDAVKAVVDHMEEALSQ